MADRTTTVLGVLAVGLGGGAVLYASQFLGPGSSPDTVQVTLLVREALSTGVLAAAGLAGFALYTGADVRRRYRDVLMLFFLAGLLGYAAGLAALTVAPPAQFSMGSPAVVFGLVVLQQVVPFTLAGFAGASIRAFGVPNRP